MRKKTAGEASSPWDATAAEVVNPEIPVSSKWLNSCMHARTHTHMRTKEHTHTHTYTHPHVYTLIFSNVSDLMFSLFSFLLPLLPLLTSLLTLSLSLTYSLFIALYYHSPGFKLHTLPWRLLDRVCLKNLFHLFNTKLSNPELPPRNQVPKGTRQECFKTKANGPGFST